MLGARRMMLDDDVAISGLDVEEVLPADLAAAFSARARQINARKGQMLIAQGSDADEVYLITSGRVNISVFSPNGRETILRDMGPGRLLGEMAAIGSQPRSASVVVVEEAVLAMISASAFRTFLRDVPGAGYWLAMQLAARVRNLTEKSSELAALPVAARLLNELLRLINAASLNGDSCVIEALPTHAELAARIGTHREAVTRELRLLAKEGRIIQSGRRLEIASRAGLSQLLERLSR